MYVETNSAYASYRLSATPEQKYGVYYCYEHAHRSHVIDNSEYITLLRERNPLPGTLQTYLGSPGLALHLLQKTARSYVFFDLEQEALDSVVTCARELGIAQRVSTIQADSIEQTLPLIERLEPGTFLHIDPYTVFAPNAQGHTYFDVFLRATERGMRCLFWYGYLTGEDRQEIGKRMRQTLRDAGLADGSVRLQSVEVFMKTIQPQTVLTNPGIVGCGVLTGNLSAKSNEMVRVLAEEMVRLYEGSRVYERHSGELCTETVIG